MKGIQLVQTATIGAHCPVCRDRILSKKHVEANLGSGYTNHYHISCFQREYGKTVEEIMAEVDELNPILVRRASKPKPLWRIERKRNEFTVQGPLYSSFILEKWVVKPELDKQMMTTGVLLGGKYQAQLITQDQLALFQSSNNRYQTVKHTYIGWYYVTRPKLILHYEVGHVIPDTEIVSSANYEEIKDEVKVYLLEGILK
jgi:hypothetical protein